MTNTVLKKSKSNLEIEKAINEGFTVNTDNDLDLLGKQNYNWDDLNKLKDELGQSILEFVFQVNSIITNKDVIDNLGNRAEDFNKTVNLFFTDVNYLSNRVKELRAEHEHRSGPITDFNDFSGYNKVAFSYQYLFSEFNSLITPTISDLVLTVAEISAQQKEEGTPNVN